MAHPLAGLTQKGIIVRPVNSYKNKLSFIYQTVWSLHLMPGIRQDPVLRAPSESVVKHPSVEVEQTWFDS